MLKKVLLVAAACVVFAVPAMADVVCPVGQIATKGVCAQPTPDQGLELLLAGNRNFAKGNVSHLDKFS